MENLPPTIVLDPLFDSFKTSKTIELFEKLKIGRQVSVKTLPEVTNGYFESKVLSRNHAEIWFENGKVNFNLFKLNFRLFIILLLSIGLDKRY
jgi:hypothetical protein